MRSVKIKAFLNEDGVMCILTDADVSVEMEFIDVVAVENDMRNGEKIISEENDPIDAYINQLCADGFVCVPDENIAVANMLYECE
jgi:hypothetical protein